VEEIHHYLNAYNLLVEELPTIDVLVIPTEFDQPQAIAQAFIYGEKLRKEHQLKVKISLTKLEKTDQAGVKAYGMNEYAAKIVWVDPTGAIEEIDLS
jgi:hypothetical protein